MCGIVGVVDTKREGRVPDALTFDRMVDALARRGPDGRGVWSSTHARLGHRRLAILDPTTASTQPMVRDDVVLTYNGELYNYQALRAQLQTLGFTFTTRGDTEVVLQAWRAWGPACVSKFNGIFAFAIVDGARTFLARDPLGVKPLFVRMHAGVVSFASELKALLADPAVPRTMNPSALDAFFTLGYVPASDSPFLGITQLPPAHTIDIVDGRVQQQRYWTPQIRESRLTLPDAVDELRQRLQRSVAQQMVSDVPLGAFLSGGLDSASVAREMLQTGAARVQTFSLGFSHASFDESAAAAATARILGTDHHALNADFDLRAQVLSVADSNDDLLADASLLAVDVLCQQARKHVTVALSGDGADELLAGYPTYVAGHLLKPWQTLPRVLRRAVRRGVALLPTSTSRYTVRDFALRFLDAAELGAGEDFASFRSYTDEAMKADVARAGLLLPSGVLAAYGAPLVDPAYQSATLLKRMLVADLLSYLPSDMLAKVDRASMRHGLEVRVPFLDVEFVDWALTLPSSLLLSMRGEKKRVLRAYVARFISPQVAHRKKAGFNVPIAAGFKGPLYELLLDTVRSEPFASDGPLQVAAVERIADAHRDGRIDAGFALYAMLTLALWWQRFVRC